MAKTTLTADVTIRINMTQFRDQGARLISMGHEK